MCLQGCGGETRGKETTEDLGVDGKIILKRVFKMCDGLWTGLIWLRIGFKGGGRL
jgi:hypothetical protein